MGFSFKGVQEILRNSAREFRAKGHPPEQCECCGRELNPAKTTYLHLNSSTGRYGVEDLPDIHSQGWFPFGWACARKVLNSGGRIRRKARV